MTRPRLLAVCAIGAGLAAACAKAPPPPPAGPDAVALEIFALSGEDGRNEDPEPERLIRLFGVDAEDSRRASLLDALAELPDREALTIEGVEELPPAGAVVVDLSANLSDGAQARYAVQLRPRDEGEGWQVHWFGGPGVEWPRARRTRDSGLTTSSPPGDGP